MCLIRDRSVFVRRLAAVAFLCFGLKSPFTYGYNYISAGCGNLNFSGGHMSFNVANNMTADELTAFKLGTDRVTLYSDSSITLNDVNDSSFGMGNGQNELYHNTAVATAQCAVTFNTTSCDVVEADLILGDQPWVSSDDAYNTFSFGVYGRSITGTAVHEGGHCVGMAHENRYYNMMGADFSHLTWNGGASHYGPGEDLSSGLINLHGKRTSTDIYRDVGVTIMRRSGADGEYSLHSMGALRNTSGVKLPVVGTYSNSQEIFEVVAGETIRFEVTLENNGEKDSETVSLGFYLSDNDFISTADNRIAVATNPPQLSRGLPWETYYTVTIPTTTTPAYYALGVFIDYDDQIPETSLSPNANNAAFYVVRVVAPSAVDSDGDGVSDAEDLCPNTPNGEAVDTSGCGPSQLDSDGDGVSDAEDNCPYISNSSQDDFDDDGLGDACDPDDDNDGLTDEVEVAIGTNPMNRDSDGDGWSDGDEVGAGTDPNSAQSQPDPPSGLPIWLLYQATK